MKKILFILCLLFAWTRGEAQVTSVAGLIPLEDAGRKVYNFNPGWRFFKGDAANAEQVSFDDSGWQVVSTPHTVELMPAEGSGCRNYQGVAWYRKRFEVPAEADGRDVVIHFESAMGKQDVWVDGRHVLSHLGGYLPFNVNLTELGIKAGSRHLIAVKVDNSNDKTYPPGKPQYTLDFAYHGGIYRDVWMIVKSKVAITDAVEADLVADGGVFVHAANISDSRADVHVQTHVANSDSRTRRIKVETTLTDAEGRRIGRTSKSLTLKPGQAQSVSQQIAVKHPNLWSPETPYLYRAESRIIENGRTIDGGITRVGIRSFEFRGAEGFWLNGKPYGQLVGANRHQDFAYVGNAVPNSQQWRDAKRLRDAGCTIIRTAHYPQDPSFMDACDEFGLFVIVATPGWQYWNKAPEFAERVHRNTREIIRRDRNHPSVLMWEPILNETRYPLDFALEALQITREEYPFEGRPVAAADVHSAGVAEHYDVVYGWPGDDELPERPRQNIFTREFGENVDDWYAHNNNNRTSRSWGERPQLVQALSLAESYDQMYRTTGLFIGGAQWHPFDHQRGYHPDPYWGGIYDAFRQPKYSYWMFRSQSPASLEHPTAESGPMVYIAHEMGPFSDSDVVVFSNCDSVRLYAYSEMQFPELPAELAAPKDEKAKAKDNKPTADQIRYYNVKPETEDEGSASQFTPINSQLVKTLPVVHAKGHMPNAPVVFEGVWDFWNARELSYKQKNWQAVNFLAEGIIGDSVVCRHLRMPSRRSTRLTLRLDTEGRQLTADGNDFIVVIAEVTDDSGNIRRLAKEHVNFTVEGEGVIIGDASIHANPRPVEWGSAPLLVRSTLTPGTIRVKASVQFPGTHAPTEAELEFSSVPAQFPACYLPSELNSTNHTATSVTTSGAQGMTEAEKRRLLDEVERQQTEFGTGK